MYFVFGQYFSIWVCIWRNPYEIFIWVFIWVPYRWSCFSIWVFIWHNPYEICMWVFICVPYRWPYFSIWVLSGATHIGFVCGCLSGSLIDGHIFLSGYVSGATHIGFVCGCLSGSLVDILPALIPIWYPYPVL